jgi:hypothetical protein
MERCREELSNPGLNRALNCSILRLCASRDMSPAFILLVP